MRNKNIKKTRITVITYFLVIVTMASVTSADGFFGETSCLKIKLEKIRIILTLGSVLILILFNIFIYIKLKKLSNSAVGTVQQQRSTYRILFYIAATTVLMYSVVMVFQGLKQKCYSVETQFYAYYALSCLFVINSTCNFFIYNFVGENFRKCLLETWKFTRVDSFDPTVSS